jgi:hypothetical protein
VAVTNRIIIKIGKGDAARGYPLDLDTVTNAEAMVAEKMTKLTWDEVKYGIATPVSITSVTALLFLARKRTEPFLTPDQVQFTISELALEDPDLLDEDPVEADGPKDDPAPVGPSSEPGTGSL